MSVYSAIKKIVIPFFGRQIKEIQDPSNIPSEGGYLIASNHVDYLDGFFITAVFAMKTEKQVKFISGTKNYFWTGGATIPLDQNNKAKSLEISLNFLNMGGIICLFPEGIRNNLDLMPKAKTGLARLALWSKKPVIPLGLIAPSGKTFLDSIKLFFFKKKKMEIMIGNPMTFNDLYDKEITKDLLDEVSRRIMKEVAVLCNKKYPY